MRSKSSSSSTAPFVIFSFLSLLLSSSHSTPVCPNITFVSAPSWSVINRTSMPGNLNGFEDGRVVRTPDGSFHLAVAEMIGSPMWVNMSIGHWVSGDAYTWNRVATLRQSSGKTDFSDPKAAVWGPSFLWDNDVQKWALLLVYYNSGPSNSSGWYGNFNGSIWLSYSDTEGENGINGPYSTETNIFYPIADHGSGYYPPYQGLQGTDSFFAYQLNNKSWMGLYGTAHTETPNQYAPMEWVIGFASSTTPTTGSLSGPWTRYPQSTPELVPLADAAENPMVFPLPSQVTNNATDAFFAIYDLIHYEGTGFGFSCSFDGVTWETGIIVDTPNGARTPFALLPMNSTDLDHPLTVALLKEKGIAETQIMAWKYSIDHPYEHNDQSSIPTMTSSLPYFAFYSQRQNNYEVVLTAIIVMSW